MLDEPIAYYTLSMIIRNRHYFFKSMTSIKVFNILIIGRSGSGKSATTKLLTSNPAIKVANSLKEVTTEVNLYEGTTF
jgi:predicted GTPase